MKKYMVVLNGRNFEIEVDGKLQNLGFYTTRWVEAPDAEQAELKAVELLRKDTSLTATVRNAANDSPMIYLSEIHEIDSFDGVNTPGGGYSFYPDQENGCQ